MANNENTFSFLGGCPTWVRVVMFLGLPTSLILVGVMLFIGYLPSPITATAHNIEAHVGESRKLESQLGEAMTKQTTLLRIICQNTAPDQRAARECLQF